MHTLVLVGELDRASAHTLEVAIEHLCESQISGITLDLTKLTYIDRTGVAVIVFRSRLCERRGYDVALIPGAWFIQRAFELTGVIDRLPFHGDDANAVHPEHTPSSVATLLGAAAKEAAQPSVGGR
jgi:anti-anti-sigma factor